MGFHDSDNDIVDDDDEYPLTHSLPKYQIMIKFK